MKQRNIWIVVIVIIGYLIFRMIAAGTLLMNTGELKLIKSVDVPNRNYKVGIYRVPSDATLQGGISVYFERKNKMEEFVIHYNRYKTLASDAIINGGALRLCLEDTVCCRGIIDTFTINLPDSIKLQVPGSKEFDNR